MSIQTDVFSHPTHSAHVTHVKKTHAQCKFSTLQAMSIESMDIDSIDPFVCVNLNKSLSMLSGKQICNLFQHWCSMLDVISCNRLWPCDTDPQRSSLRHSLRHSCLNNNLIVPTVIQGCVLNRQLLKSRQPPRCQPTANQSSACQCSLQSIQRQNMRMHIQNSVERMLSPWMKSKTCSPTTRKLN